MRDTSPKEARRQGTPVARGPYSAALLKACGDALARVLPLSAPADSTLSAFFREHPELGQRDRALVADTVYAALRRRRLLESAADTRVQRRRVLAVWALLMGASDDDLRAVLHEDDAQWLSAVRSAARAPQPFEVQCDLPDWLIERLLATQARGEVLALAQALHEQAPLDLRVNVFKASRDTVLERLSAAGWSPRETPWSPEGLRLQGRPPVNAHPLFLDGSVEVQDEGSQLVCHLVAPARGEMVVDFCAGAGGKTLALGAMMRSTGRLYAFDVSAPRLAKLKARLARSGLSNVHPQRLEHENDARVKRLAGKVDRVLVDAPCTGFGTLRRNPDLKWRLGPGDLARLVQQQGAILGSAARLVKPGGRLVYATCSLLEEENAGVVGPFMESHPDFVLMPAGTLLRQRRIPLESGDWLQLTPHRQGTDGFFAAVLQRRLP